jgi:hypothetical protein
MRVYVLKPDWDCKISVVIAAWFDLMFLAHQSFRRETLRACGLAGNTTLAKANNP